jgi:CRP-like cAMP-binding protein
MKNKKENTKNLEKFIQEQFQTKETLPFETFIRKYKKNTILLSPGEVEKNIYFISSGIVQSSILTTAKQEKIFGIAFPQQFFCSLRSFITQKPTDLTFTCITDCVLEVIPRDSFNQALENSMLANKFMKYFYEYIYLMRANREKDILTLTGSERYLKLIKEQPEIAKKFSVDKIAKYLGIHPRSLSRLRKNVVTN